MCIQGGYKTVTVTQVANVVSAYDAGELNLTAVRVYLGVLVSVASREAAKRSRMKSKKRGEVIPQFFIKELSRVTGLSLRGNKKGVRDLERLGLLSFGESEIIFSNSPNEGSFELQDSLAGKRSALRPIPLSRPLLRFLARCPRVSTIKTALAYAARGLTLSRNGEITGKGSVKARWIANVMNLSERAVRGARAELIELNWLFDDEGSKQWKLNRDGAYFKINLEWGGVIKELSKKVINREGSEGAHPSPAAERVPVDNLLPLPSNFAPRLPQNCSDLAGPYKYKKTPYGSKDQKTRKAEPPRIESGVCKANIKIKEPPPKIYDVKVSDLGHFSRVEELYFQAVRRKLIEPTEAGALNFLAAAVRAKGVPGDPPRVFMGIVRRKLWKHITQADEDRALSALKRYREINPQRFCYKANELKEAA